MAQVEFYFGDANYPKDKFLLKEAKKDADGFIAIRTVASFARMKKLTKSWRAVAETVRDSDVVELSPDGRKMRRRHPLPVPKVHSSWQKSCIVEGLADTAIDAVKSRCALPGGRGAVTLVRVVDPAKLPGDLAAYMQASGAKRKHPALKGRRPVVVVEYDSEAAAVAACESLNDPGNWRSGLKVSLLWHRPLPSETATKKATKGQQQKAAAAAAAPVEPLKVTRPRLQLAPNDAAADGTESPAVPRKLEGRTRDPLGPDGTTGFGVRGSRAGPSAGRQEQPVAQAIEGVVGMAEQPVPEEPGAVEAREAVKSGGTGSAPGGGPRVSVV